MTTRPNRIGRYEIKGRLAGGGMGNLYLARDTNPTTDRLVALKLLRASFDSDDLRERFAREAQALAQLTHPNIVTIYDSGEFDESPFIVMEYVRGETLAERIRRRAPMSIGLRLRLLGELCDGLAHAHELGIVHRDIKPANLLVDVHGRLKILDFGIVRVMDASVGSTGLTRVNTGIGTPGYMSPEQARGGTIDARSDVFSVGTVAFELLVYREAFSGTTSEVYAQLLGDGPPPSLAAVDEIDPELATALARALEKDVDRRCQSARELGEAFERIRARLGTAEQMTRATPPPVAVGERKSRRERAAEVAFQRARASRAEGAESCARRSAIEALAEDPQHAGAREMLVEFGSMKDVEPWLPRATDPGERATLDAGAPPTSVATALPTRPSVPSSEPATQPPANTRPEPMSLNPTVAAPAPAAAAGQPAPAVSAAQPARSANAAAASPTNGPASIPTVKPAGTKRGARRAGLTIAAVATVALAAGATGFLVMSRGVALTIVRPTGGTIRTDDGINCGTTGTACTASRARGTAVLLQATPDSGFVFSSWTGDCASGGASFVMSSTRTCGAEFTSAPASAPASPVVPVENLAPAAAAATLTIAKPAGGTVVGPGIRCGSGGAQCEGGGPVGTLVTIAYEADKGFKFAGFTGDCDQSGRTLLSKPRRCGATFVKAAAVAAMASLAVTRPTGGTITGSGITCGTGGTQCAASLAQGTSVTLKAEPDAGFRFVAFTGACDAGGTTVMSAARACGATFVAAAPVQRPTAWTTNLPNTTVAVVQDERRIALTFGGTSQYAGYTAVLAGDGKQFEGEASKPGCATPSHVTVNVGDNVLTGQFELRSCSGRGSSKTGMVLVAKR
jgi:hypothetical protein